MPQIWGIFPVLKIAIAPDLGKILGGKINSKEAIIIQEHASAIREHKFILFFPCYGLRKKLFEINVFLDFKIAPDLGQFPRSEGFFVQELHFAPDLGKFSCAGGNSTSKSVNTQTNYMGKSKSPNLVKSRVPLLKNKDDLTISE